MRIHMHHGEFDKLITSIEDNSCGVGLNLSHINELVWCRIEILAKALESNTSIQDLNLGPDNLSLILKESASRGHLAVVNRLLKIPNIVSIHGNSALQTAAEYGRVSIVNRLLEEPEIFKTADAPGKDWNSFYGKYTKFYKNGALINAVGGGSLEIVNRLLQIPSILQQVAEDDNLALRDAASFGHLHIVNRLLEIQTILTKLITSYEEEELVHFGLGSCFVQKTTLDHGALRIAIKKNHLNIVYRLLQTYRDNQIPFPDIKIKDFDDLNSFFTSFAALSKETSDILHQYLPPHWYLLWMNILELCLTKNIYPIKLLPFLHLTLKLVNFLAKNIHMMKTLSFLNLTLKLVNLLAKLIGQLDGAKLMNSLKDEILEVQSVRDICEYRLFMVQFFI